MAANTAKTMAAEEKKWRADADLSTLIEAEKIKADKARFSAAMKMRKEKMAAMASIDEEKDE